MLTIKNTEKNTFAQELQPLSLSIGIIHAIDNVDRVASVAVGGLTSFIYAVLPGFDANRTSVETTEAFSIGDQVLIAYSPRDTAMSAGTTDKGIIVCKVSVNNTTFTSLTTKAHSLPHDHLGISEQEEPTPVAGLYADQGIQAGYDVSQFPPNNNINNYVGQAYNLSGENTNLHVSHDEISLSTNNSNINLNTFGIAAEQHLLKSSRSLAENGSELLVGDTLLKESIQDSDLKASTQRVVKFGALSDGLSDGIVDRDGNVLSRVKRDLNGFTKVDVSHGFIVDRGAPVSIFTNTDKAPIQNITDELSEAVTAASSDCFIEDAIKDSNNVKLNRNAVKSGVLPPIDKPSDAKMDGLTITNPLTGRTTKTALGRSRFGELPDGSFVISDSWGSEIRMFGGDIFITPARRLIITASDDAIVTAGGGVAITGDKVVDIASASGSVELVGKSVNVMGTDSAEIVSGIVTVAGTSVGINADKHTKISSADSLDIVGGSDINVVAPRTNIVGTESSTLSTRHSCIKVKNDLVEVGGARCTVLSDLTVLADTSKEFKVGDLTVSPRKGTGFIGCEGYCTVGKGLSVNSWAKVRENIATSAITVSRYNKEAVGVFTGKQPQKEELPNKVLVSGVDGSSDSKFTETPKADNVRTSTSKFFKVEPSPAYAIVPGIVAGGGSQLSSVTVEGTAGREYIYPGKDFWEKSGLYVISPETYYNVYDAPDMNMYGMSKFKKSK